MKTFLRVLWRGLLVILCGVFLGVFIFAAYQLYHTFHGYRQAEKEYDNLSAQYVSTPTPEASQTPTPTPEATQAPTPTPEVASGPIQVDFAALQARNNEVIGWIYSPNTKINYPVVKGITTFICPIPLTVRPTPTAASLWMPTARQISSLSITPFCTATI